MKKMPKHTNIKIKGAQELFLPDKTFFFLKYKLLPVDSSENILRTICGQNSKPRRFEFYKKQKLNYKKFVV